MKLLGIITVILGIWGGILTLEVSVIVAAIIFMLAGALLFLVLQKDEIEEGL